MSSPRILIIGAGPTGLGAGYRLQELGYSNWALYERHPYVGGHAASWVDPQGFTWDEGCHVLFSHYAYFDRLIDRLLGDDYLEHMRESWIRLGESWIPYPFQNNIRYLPPAMVLECLEGLLDAAGGPARPPAHFAEWVHQTFGAGIARHFLLPYNRKVWACDPARMAYQWIGERVSTVDVKRILRNVVLGLDDVSWGPNRTFKFPTRGATGELYRRMASGLQSQIHLEKRLSGVDLARKQVTFADGTHDLFDALIATGPLDELIAMAAPVSPHLQEAAGRLVHNRLYITGIGLSRPNPTSRCWLYFPEDRCPFYRVSNFSMYAPSNVPNGDVERYSSFMCEMSYLPGDPVWTDLPAEAVIDRTVQGLLRVGVLEPSDLPKIVSRHVIPVDYGYPVPTLDRDEILALLQPFLESHQVYARGRFGGWKYEIANMDHSVMQGVEVVNRLLQGEPETVWRPMEDAVTRHA